MPTGHFPPCGSSIPIRGESSPIRKNISDGRAGEIRTRDLLVPNEALYQAEPRPDIFAAPEGRQLTKVEYAPRRAWSKKIQIRRAPDSSTCRLATTAVSPQCARLMSRFDGRAAEDLREIRIEPGIAPHAHGSVLVSFGATRVICAAMFEESVPRWMREQGVVGGWLTAEYSMLPYSTISRKPREIARGKPDGRGTEIQRLIGRSLRAAVDLTLLGSRTLWVDCDVLQADGGTRTAAITGACVAAELACRSLMAAGTLAASPLVRRVAAVSVGLVDDEAVLDLNYEEDKVARVDMNLVMTDRDEFVEVQGSGEEAVFTMNELAVMLERGRDGIRRLIDIQNSVLMA